MTVDSGPLQISNFVSNIPPTFYKAKVQAQHWQLRSLLASPTSGLIYYPCDYRIFSLDTHTRKRRLVAKLNFEPRCMNAKYGWVCAGGVKDGEFAAIRVREIEEDIARREHNDGAPGTDEMETESEGSGARSPPRLQVNVKNLGGTIVNSVTLYRPLNSPSDDDVTAVLTNNDCKLRLLHLPTFRLTAVLTLPIATNHATISPDGSTLLAVGDSPHIFFFTPHHRTPYWAPSRPPIRVTQDSDTLISTAISPDSRLAAVASQSGTITILSTSTFQKLHTIPSSRPPPPGSIRSLFFTPAPWDLLIFAEHSGRVTITDSRNGFTTRQTLNIPVDDDNAVPAPIAEVDDLPVACDPNRSLFGPMPGTTDDPDSVWDDGGDWFPSREARELIRETSPELFAYTEQLRRVRPRGEGPRRRGSVHPAYGGEENGALVQGGWGGVRSGMGTGVGRYGGGGGGYVQRVLVGTREAEDGAEVLGVALRVDSRKLFIATDKGILEYRLNLASRKVFPACDPR